MKNTNSESDEFKPNEAFVGKLRQLYWLNTKVSSKRVEYIYKKGVNSPSNVTIVSWDRLLSSDMHGGVTKKTIQDDNNESNEGYYIRDKEGDTEKYKQGSLVLIFKHNFLCISNDAQCNFPFPVFHILQLVILMIQKFLQNYKNDLSACIGI